MTDRAHAVALKSLGTAALVGRVNVGKSTLFNRCIDQRKALVSSAPGTTRDVQTGICHWRGRDIELVDTGGFVEKPTDDIERKVHAHAISAIKKATVIVLVTDGKDGLLPDDRAYLRLIRQVTKIPVVLVVNKADTAARRGLSEHAEWLALGLGEPHMLSAISGSGVGDFLDVLVSSLDGMPYSSTPEESIRLAIVGRTNVGKSSLLNQLLGDERAIVSDTPHTTREPHDVMCTYDGVTYCIIDTVGIRKKSRIASRIDREGMERSLACIERADVVLLVLESTVTPSKQESRLAQAAVDAGAGLVLVVNKWDLVEGKDAKSVLAYESSFRKFLPFVPWAPLLFISALTGQRVARIFSLVQQVQQDRSRLIAQEDITVFLKRALARQKPIWLRGRKKPIVSGITQAGVRPPRFAIHVNDTTAIQYAYLRYIENRLRDLYGFIGTPIVVYTEKVIKSRAI